MCGLIIHSNRVTGHHTKMANNNNPVLPDGRRGINNEVNAAPVTALGRALQWIGFTDQQCNSLEAEIGSIEDLSSLTHKDISELKKSYAARTITEGRIHFGVTRTKHLKALTDWAEDYVRIGKEPDIKEDTDWEQFFIALDDAAQRAEIRTIEMESATSRAKEATPGKLVSEKDWDKWEASFENQLSIMLGVQGVPLLYVI